MAKDYNKMPTLKVSAETKNWIDKNKYGITITNFLDKLFQELAANYAVSIKNGEVKLHKLDEEFK